MAKSVLIIYTGGTIGMVLDPATQSLAPFNFSYLRAQVPEIERLEIELLCEAFDPPVDSSDITPSHWQQIASLIAANYDRVDGFVVLHGTDTMAYTASALSFMLEGLAKPVIFTGSQLPIGVLRTDGKENLITAIQLAALEKAGEPYIHEVAIYFGSKLYRGNRTHKYSAEDFNAFHSPNLPALAEVGIHFHFKHELLLRQKEKGPIQVRLEMEEKVAVLKLFPGISEMVVRGICALPKLRGLVLETFGSGNGMTAPWFEEALREARDRGVAIVNVTQCNTGFVEQGRYATSAMFLRLGVIPAGDMTIEAAVTKLMHILAQSEQLTAIELAMLTPMRGELTTSSSLV